MSRPFLLSIGVLALCACSRQGTPAQQASDAEPQAPAVSAASEPEPSSTESSLALKRGVLSLAADRVTFQPCAQAQALWVIDQTDGMLHKALGDEPQPSQWYAELHGERMALTEELARTYGYAAAFVLEEVLYAAPVGESHGCEQRANDFVVAARGNEPFWAIDVRHDQTLLWRQPEEPRQLTFEILRSEDAEGTVAYFAAAGDRTLELFVDALPCRDSMSGAYFAYSARAKLDDRQLKGCARIGESP